MGKAIVYCGVCGKSLLEEEFQKGRAVRTPTDSFCARCSPVDLAALPARPVSSASTPSLPTISSGARPSKTSTARLPTISTRRIRSVGPAASTAVWVGAGGLVALLALATIMAFVGPSRPRPSNPAASAGDRAPVRPPPAPKPSVEPAPAAPPRPAAPSPPSGVEQQMRQELEAQRAGRLDRDIEEARRLIDSPRAAGRVSEIDALLDALARVSGDRGSDVAKLRALFEARLAGTPPAAPPAAPTPAPAKPIPPGLEGHWTLEGLTMGKADDVSGHERHATAVGSLTFVSGRLGRAAAFDGSDAYLELPRGEALDRLQEGSYTLGAWFKPAEIPRGPEPMNGAFYGIVIKPGLHIGLSYSFEVGGSFEMMHWLRDLRKGGGFSPRPYAPGAWYHLAGTADPVSARTRLYVNGEPVVDAAWPPGDRVADPAHARKPWRIGIALPKAKEWGWSAKGAVDDVRLYSRILAPAEIRELADGR